MQLILSQEALSLQFLDVVSILLKYCGPKSHQKGETQAVIVDLVATLGFFCANNERNQVSENERRQCPQLKAFLKFSENSSGARCRYNYEYYLLDLNGRTGTPIYMLPQGNVERRKTPYIIAAITSITASDGNYISMSIKPLTKCVVSKMSANLTTKGSIK